MNKLTSTDFIYLKTLTQIHITKLNRSIDDMRAFGLNSIADITVLEKIIYTQILERMENDSDDHHALLVHSTRDL